MRTMDWTVEPKFLDDFKNMKAAYRQQLVIIRFFSFNLELICTCELFKELKLRLPKRLVQFQLFEYLTRAN